jgi:putative endonuclease
MTDKTCWVYILSSRFRGTLYVGVTNSLENRIAQHKAKEVEGFTKTYGVDRLVWFQSFGEVTEAIAMEKRIKRWRRDWKIRLIEEDNPHWDDLYVAMTTVPAAVHPVLMGPGLPLTRKPG